MKKEDFQFLIDVKKEFEFSYNKKLYSLTYGTDSNGEYILFGPLYEGSRFYSLGELLQEARVENHFFREVLETL